MFGSAVGIIAGRTVTRHGRENYPVEIAFVPGGAAVMFVRKTNDGHIPSVSGVGNARYADERLSER